MKNILLVLILTQFFKLNNFAQDTTNTNYLSVVPGEKYEAGEIHKFFFGEHWRDVWTKKIKVPILDLNKFAGGLTPIKRGGGFQTKSLRLRGNDGHIWKFRSIQKDPAKALTPDLRESLVNDILQDQISSSLPFAPLVVSPLLDSVRVLQSRPYLFFMPDTPFLKEFREEFGGIAGFLEIHPAVSKKKLIGFKNAEKVVSTFKLFHRLEKNRSESVNDGEYLKARLIDLLIGDWDRHTDQWKWAMYEKKGKKIWYPIPRDRDQAFAKFDGILPAIASSIVPQFNNFDENYSNIKDLTWNGRFVDRRFLTEINKTKWDSITAFVKLKMTDLTIEKSVKKLPPVVYKIAGNELTEKLKSRRDKLEAISNDFYVLINSVVDIYCTKKNDSVIIKRISNELTSVQIYGSSHNKYKSSPYYSKIFDNNITEEIRIYCLAGDDLVTLDGEVDKSPIIRIIGGKGKDIVTDNSKVAGLFLGLLPIRTWNKQTYIYDSGKKTVINYGGGTVYKDDKIYKPVSDEEKYRPLQKNRSSLNYNYPILKYNSDNGLYLGGGILLYKYGFREIPYKTRLNANLYYASIPSNAAIHFGGKFNSIVKNSTINIDIEGSGLEFTKYYGYGNQTKVYSELEENDYYKLEQKLFSFSPSIDFRLSDYSLLNLGFSFSYSKSELKNESLLNGFPYENYGLGDFSLIKILSGFTFDTRENINNSQKGILIDVKNSYSPKVFSNKSDFSTLTTDVRYFISIPTKLKTTFAFRAYGEKVFGKHPFLEASFLGGEQNLLGYRLDRYSGNSSLLGSVDIRTLLGKIKLIIEGKIGVHFFGSSGRVYAKNNISDKWHSSYGGGIWVSYLNRKFNVILTFAHSEESNRLYGGFTFNI